MKFGKNALIWVVAFVVLTAVFSYSENKNFASDYEKLAFSDFMDKVKEKHIANVL